MYNNKNKNQVKFNNKLYFNQTEKFIQSNRKFVLWKHKNELKTCFEYNRIKKV